MITLADRVKWARRITGWNQNALAIQAGISAPEVSLVEGGQRSNLNARVLVGLARALGVNADWLATGQGEPPTEEQIRIWATAGEPPTEEPTEQV